MMDWDGSLETGDERIDAEHRRLVQLFNDLSESAADGEAAVRDALETLTEYVATHFAHEEERMEASGFPSDELQAHVAEHRSLTNDVRDRVLLFRTGSLTIAELVAFLREWLSHHVHEVDLVLVRHMHSCEQQG